MNINKERFFYYAGTAFFIIAVLEVTVFPQIISLVSFDAFDSIVKNKNNVLFLYLLGFFAYILSPKYYRLQLAALFLIFIVYCLYQFYYKISISMAIF